mgnify:FL=1
MPSLQCKKLSGNKVALVYQWSVKLGAAPCGIIKNYTLRINDVITDCIKLKLSGTATDNVIQCFGGNMLKKEKPVLAIEVSSKVAGKKRQRKRTRRVTF